MRIEKRIKKNRSFLIEETVKDGFLIEEARML
jgi:hypothetical protein